MSYEELLPQQAFTAASSQHAVALRNRTCAAPLSARAARAARAADAAHTRARRQPSLRMVSLKTAFMVHGVVGFLFCLPIAFGGLKGFLSMMAEPEVVTWDKCVRCPCRALPCAT